MISRHFDAKAINDIVNDPDVYEWVRGNSDGPLDLTDIIKNLDNVCLMGDHGGVLFTKLQPGIYEAHTQVVKAGRGQWTIDMVNAALAWMFTHTDALEIVTKCPKGNLSARALAKAIHGSFEFRIEKGWILRGAVVPCDVFSLSIQRWMSTAPNLEDAGKQFHESLEEQYERMGRQDPIHDEDAAHDRYVGAAGEMMRGGQPYKAAIFYNRWAELSGYAAIRVVSASPMIIDIQEALLMVSENDFTVMRIN